VALCQQAQPASTGSSSLAHEFNLVCADGAVDSCVPACSEALRGDLLLMNLNGEDSKYSCELHHGQFSWIGPSGEGGYLGSDPQAFLSAVISGAAGYYALSLEEGAEINTDLAVSFGQNVCFSGGGGASAVPTWGTGSFTVQRGGALALSGVALAGDLMVQGGGNTTVNGGSLAGNIGVEPGGSLQLEQALWQGQTVTLVVTQNPQCYQPYTNVSDAYRAISYTADTSHNDCASGTGVGGGGWYRFSSAGGDALPLQPPGGGHCGTEYAGWLSGWDGSGRAGVAPPGSYSTPGRYPAATEGVVEMTACFDRNAGHCEFHAVVGAVMCEGFLLWRLPYEPGCSCGYCTAASGLW
jgi:hypothetical protein